MKQNLLALSHTLITCSLLMGGILLSLSYATDGLPSPSDAPTLKESSEISVLPEQASQTLPGGQQPSTPIPTNPDIAAMQPYGDTPTISVKDWGTQSWEKLASWWQSNNQWQKGELFIGGLTIFLFIVYGCKLARYRIKFLRLRSQSRSTAKKKSHDEKEQLCCPSCGWLHNKEAKVCRNPKCGIRF